MINLFLLLFSQKRMYEKTCPLMQSPKKKLIKLLFHNSFIFLLIKKVYCKICLLMFSIKNINLLFHMEKSNVRFAYEMSCSSESEIDDFDVNVNDLQPYSFEPPAEPGQNITTNEQTGQSLRKDNTNWCSCGNCQKMDTEVECKCCRDSDEVPDDYFGGKQCINETEHFKQVCLTREVLRATLNGLNNTRGDRINVCNRSLRYAGYRMFTWWVHNRLGRGVRKVIPSCAIWAIRNAYPEADNMHYVPFQEAKDEMNA